MMPSFAIVSLGCPRNLIDSEVISGSLKKEGYKVVGIEDSPDAAIVNTCAFIDKAREESIETLLEIADLKRRGKVRHIVVCGCLGQMYNRDLAAELPEADLVIGTGDIPKLPKLMRRLTKLKARSRVSSIPRYLYNENSPRYLLTPRHFAYVKISEGCDNLCSYCVISRLRGRLRSRTVMSVLREADALASRPDLKELILIGQDTTRFGVDRYGRPRLADLLRRLCRLDNDIGWIRLMYTHPAHFAGELIRAIAEERKICRYIDMPIQHVSGRILKLMNRRAGMEEIERLIEKLRSLIKGVALRTSIIVGFPGETDRDFRQLLSFVRRVRFEKLGAFLYSREDATPAGRMRNQIPEKIKQERFDELMALAKRLSEGIQKEMVGRRLKVLIDEKYEDKKGFAFVGRTEHDAPDIDGVVYVSGRSIEVGKFCDVRITGSMEYDLIGEEA